MYSKQVYGFTPSDQYKSELAIAPARQWVQGVYREKKDDTDQDNHRS